jgi:putative polyhydroxyalkanoate system protein
MADIDITRSHAMSTDDAKAAVERVAQDLKDEYGVSYDWEGDTLDFEGSGTDGRIDVRPDEVDVSIGLNFMLRNTMKGTIERRAKELLDEHLQ